MLRLDIYRCMRIVPCPHPRAGSTRNHETLDVMSVGLFFGLGDGFGQAAHVGLTSPVEARQFTFRLKKSGPQRKQASSTNRCHEQIHANR